MGEKREDIPNDILLFSQLATSPIVISEASCSKWWKQMQIPQPNIRQSLEVFQKREKRIKGVGEVKNTTGKPRVNYLRISGLTEMELSIRNSTWA